jgi:predicted PurR-regulated permease PerM
MGAESGPQEGLTKARNIAIAIGVFVLIGFLLWQIVAPLLQGLLLAVALAVLLRRLVHLPLLSLSKRLLPWLPERSAAHLAGIFTTFVLGAALFFAFFLLAVLIVGSLEGATSLLWGLSTGDQDAMVEVRHILSSHVARLGEQYPDLYVPPEKITAFIDDLLTSFHTLRPQLAFDLFKQTGSLVLTILLAISVLPGLLAYGPEAGRGFISMLPLSHKRRNFLIERGRWTIRGLLVETLATALVHGVAMGCLAGLFTQAPAVLIGILAAAASLLPVIGSGVVWIPLVLLEWRTGHPIAAGALAISALALHSGLAWLRAHLARRTYDEHGWRGLLLLIGILGGLMAFGPIGLMTGPLIMGLAIVAGEMLVQMMTPEQHTDEQTSSIV